MKPVAVILFKEDPFQANTEILNVLRSNPLIEKVITVGKFASSEDVLTYREDFPLSGRCISKALDMARACSFVLIIQDPYRVDISSEEIEKFVKFAKEDYGALYYADYYCKTRSPSGIRPLIDYQYGSIRDDFSFGLIQFYSIEHIHKSLEKYGQLTETHWAGLYELRLKVSLVGDIVRIPEPLYLFRNEQPVGTSPFDYLDHRLNAYQKEMEHTVTHHLKRIGAHCSHEFKSIPKDSGTYPVKASVVMPVRNREKTVADAIRSAVSQKTDFPFNVLVVQNHSTDNTREEIERVAKLNSRVIQIIPGRKDLGIGGCWNLAVQSTNCGQYICQLDSDDLYEGEDALATMIETLQHVNCGMAVGTYRVVNHNLEEIPPGVVDHREWSEENGRNNLLRVNGIGAPRGFPTVLLKQYPFPNVSYGEDYAVALRISRDFHVSRIFKPLYLCRRWEENTDSNLSKIEENKFALYKDRLRTHEILERQKLNRALDF